MRSMNPLAVIQVFIDVEVRDFQRADSANGQRERLIDRPSSFRLAELLPSFPQRAENSGSIEALTLAVVAKGHCRMSPLLEQF